MEKNFNIFEEIDLLYHAVSDPSYLEQFLKLLRNKTDSISGSIQIDNLDTLEVVDGVFQGFSDSAIDSYIQYFAPLDVTKQAAINSKLFYSDCLPIDKVIRKKDFYASQFYNEWVKPETGFVDAMGTCIQDFDKRQSMILTLQRDKTASRFVDDNSQDYINQLRPFLCPAMRAMKLQSSQLAGSNGAIMYLEYPALLVDKSLKIVEANSLAQQLLNEQTWLWTLPNDVLRFKLDLQKTVAKAVKQCIDIFEHPFDGGFNSIYFYLNENQSFDIQWLPYSSRCPSSFLRVQQQRLALLTIKPRKKNLDLDLLRKLFCLSVVETQTLARIFEGLSIKQISTQTQRSEHTIRSCLKDIYKKTKVNRQSDLVLLIASSAAYR
jgi:DNA-binding CsgD family transcriptional regulator